MCILPSRALGLNLYWRVVVCVDDISKFDSGVYKSMDVFFGRVNWILFSHSAYTKYHYIGEELMLQIENKYAVALALHKLVWPR